MYLQDEVFFFVMFPILVSMGVGWRWNRKGTISLGMGDCQSECIPILQSISFPVESKKNASHLPPQKLERHIAPGSEAQLVTSHGLASQRATSDDEEHSTYTND